MTSVLGAEAIRLIRLVARLSFYFSSTAARANWCPTSGFYSCIHLNAAGSAYSAVFPRFISERAGERDRNHRISMCYLIYKIGKLRDLCARPREDFQSSHLFGGKLFDRQSQQSSPQVLAPALIRAGASDKCQRSLANERSCTPILLICRIQSERCTDTCVFRLLTTDRRSSRV